MDSVSLAMGRHSGSFTDNLDRSSACWGVTTRPAAAATAVGARPGDIGQGRLGRRLQRVGSISDGLRSSTAWVASASCPAQAACCTAATRSGKMFALAVIESGSAIGARLAHAVIVARKVREIAEKSAEGAHPPLGHQRSPSGRRSPHRGEVSSACSNAVADRHTGNLRNVIQQHSPAWRHGRVEQTLEPGRHPRFGRLLEIERRHHQHRGRTRWQTHGGSTRRRRAVPPRPCRRLRACHPRPPGRLRSLECVPPR